MPRVGGGRRGPAHTACAWARRPATYGKMTSAWARLTVTARSDTLRTCAPAALGAIVREAGGALGGLPMRRAAA